MIMFKRTFLSNICLPFVLEPVRSTKKCNNIPYKTSASLFPTTINHFFARCFAVDFGPKKLLYTKTGKRCVLKADRVPLCLLCFRIYWGRRAEGPKTDKKRWAFVSSMSVVIESKFFKDPSFTSCVGEKQAFFCNELPSPAPRSYPNCVLVK